MLARMDADDLLWWAGYSELEPWGEDRADLRAGIVASEIANTPARLFGKPGSCRPRDMMPDFTGERTKQQSAKEMALKAMMWVCGRQPQPAGGAPAAGR